MNCIIVDDEEMSRSAMNHLLQKVDFLDLKCLCSDAIQAIDALKKHKIDLMFLDIEMPDMSGMDLVKSLETKPIIIFTTSYKDYAIDAFEYNVVDYLIKPVSLPRLLKAVSKAKNILDATKDQVTITDKDYFFIKYNSLLTKIFFKDILWIEALGDYITINTPNKKFVLHLTLKYIEGKLPKDKFARVHRSFIVAIDNITAFEDGTICIGKQLIPIGAMHKEEFFNKLNLL